MNDINNLDIYNNRMRKSMEDKLFFLNVLPEKINSFIDFGCADGTLLAYVKEEMPNVLLYGIDMNKDMLDIARKNVPSASFMCGDLPSCFFIPENKGSVLNLSSVLHEVYSYCTNERREEFWKSINDGNYEYVVIRDMIYNGGAMDRSPSHDIYNITTKANSEQILDFQQNWGNICYYKNLVHFLLKYRYTENWDREVKENYLGYSTEDIIKKLPKYDLIYRKDYILPYIYDTVKKDFDIELKTPTHTNLIFKLK